MQRKDERPRVNGRFAKKSSAGDDAGAGISADDLGGARPIRPAKINGWDPSTDALAHPDRPGVASVHTAQDLEREALAAVASAPIAETVTDQVGDGIAPPAAAGPSEAEVLAGYEMVCTELISSGADALLPAWRITPPEVSKLSTACSKALMLWFPDMIIPPKYMALLVVAGVGFEIAQARKDPSTGRYHPARVPDRAPETIDQTPAPAH